LLIHCALFCSVQGRNWYEEAFTVGVGDGRGAGVLDGSKVGDADGLAGFVAVVVAAAVAGNVAEAVFSDDAVGGKCAVTDGGLAVGDDWGVAGAGVHAASQQTTENSIPKRSAVRM
jgi:hypothetical protein